ncbi:MAG: YceD family protein [Castellaniella sp.]
MAAGAYVLAYYQHREQDWIRAIGRYNVGSLNTPARVEAAQRYITKVVDQWTRIYTMHAPSGQAWLDVEAQGPVRVVCQRCLEAFDLTLRVSGTLGLVETQAQLDAMDALEAEGQGPEIEYLVSDQRLDVLGLVEDELILALPYAPRHETCPGDGDVPEPPRRPSPFAALKDLGKD